ncbi:GNAT family N-acetyltransferase [Peterkaempfera bronchialis]|uniref:GNAT family N-acetyltransferase n=1 Tax=Peterkaempfera bronchialis TaxID=2126346 RepID=A0A345ST44_9ACTN|nr:GNAT family N-acetyltransferase [Peterkaempfera bronchialis]AXI76899.1 GNAT family N-acetyltransferase [Peterkaempfera bronchialis]
MFQLRRATADGRGPVEAMMPARARWMADNGLADAEAWRRSAPELAAQACEEPTYMWVLLDGERIAGCTSAYDETAPTGWIRQERAESAVFLATTVTGPDYRRFRPGRLIALWALDHAARMGVEWVRRGTTKDGLVRYYRDVQGWERRYSVPVGERTVHMLGRRAERVPELPQLMAGTVLA